MFAHRTIVVSFLALFLLASATVATKPCVGKPCSREFKPVSVSYGEGKCRGFSNLCVLENEIQCNRIAVVANMVCKIGFCRDNGDVFPCPKAVV